MVILLGRNLCSVPLVTMSRPSSDMAAFRSVFNACSKLVVLSGAGVSAESGVPTFRGAGGYWRKYQAQDLACPHAFSRNPSLVWEFYHYRRELMLTKEPNAAHYAIADCEKRFSASGKKLTVVTQNIDELHRAAGSCELVELHGSLFRTQCTACGDVTSNRDSPICPALKDRGAPEPGVREASIPLPDLPRCSQPGCGGLLRPDVVWFGENLNPDVLLAAEVALDECDLCLVVGTSSIVYPAAMFAPAVAARGVPVAEFNLEETPATDKFGFHFSGPCGSTLPEALAPFQ